MVGAVPIAFVIESNGRIGRETGNEGVRRVSGTVFVARGLVFVFPLANACADCVFGMSRRVGMDEKIG